MATFARKRFTIATSAISLSDYQLSTDKDSGITNDPNDWAREHDDPQYILNLLKRIITVSLETMKVVNALPALKERKDT